MGTYDEMNLAVQMLSGGKNKVILDDVGMPGIYVSIPKGYNGNVIAGGDTSVVHPAFKVDGVEKDEFWYSKYQNYVFNERAYSLPGYLPKTTINQPDSKIACTKKGKGFHLGTMPEWAYIALWCRKNGTMPHGNNNYGADTSYPAERGTSIRKDSQGRIEIVAPGSGPATWAHDFTNAGIYDMNGNIWEWMDGMRLVDGEIQIIANNDAALGDDCDTGATSTLWKAIMPDGSLVEPGTSGTLHYDWLSSKITLTSSTTSTENTARGTSYTSLGLENSLDVPEIAKALLIYPDEPGGDYAGDYHYMNPTGERLPVCGGRWVHGGHAGVFCVDLGSLRSGASGSVGFRSAYVDL